jgi:uncharacterized Zn finger protein
VTRRNGYYDDFYPPSRPIRTDQGLKARSQHGKIGQSWWAGRWIAALERLVDAGRLSRGRSYARAGQVLSIEERGGQVKARVQGSRPKPYTVSIELKRLTDAQWEAVVERMAERAAFVAHLLAGEMPQDIEEAFVAAGVSLFPDRSGDLITSCSCPDSANPCKHVAASHYILAERFDEDPFMLFRLRGRSEDQILAALRERRAGAEGLAAGAPGPAIFEAGEGYEAGTAGAAPPGADLSEALATFWQPGERLEQLASPARRGQVAMPGLKRLGPAAFLPGQDLIELLAPAYEAIAAAALAAAGSDAGGTEPDAASTAEGPGA